MKTFMYRLIAVVFFVSLGSSAQSQDWSGIYFGGHVGYADADMDWNFANGNPYSNPAANAPITVPGVAFSAEGAIAGGQLGYNYQFSNFVLGAEIEYSETDLDDSRNHPSGAFVSNPPRSAVDRTKIDNLLMLTGKAGYVWGEKWLAYVKGGYARARVKTRGDADGVTGFSFNTTSKWQDGWTLGVGLAHKFTNQLSLAVEYAHVDLDDKRHVGILPATPDFPVQNNVDAEIDTVTLRLNLHLHRPAQSVPLK